MDGLKKLLIGNKLNHLTTARILNKGNREKAKSKARLMTCICCCSMRGPANLAESG